MAVATEGAGTDAALAARCCVSASSLSVSLERPGGNAGTVANSAALHSAALHSATLDSAASEIAPVIKCPAAREVPGVVVERVVVMPVESPMTPSPSKTAEPADAEAESEREIRTAKPDSWIWVPSRPRHDGISVNQPGVIRRHVNHIGVGRLNVDIRAIVLHDFLLRGLQIAGL